MPSSRLYLAPNRYATRSNNSTDYWGHNTALIKVPAEKYLIGDAGGANSAWNFGSRNCMAYSPFDEAAATGSWNSCRGHIWPIHNDTANMGFCDGHAKAIKPDVDKYGDTTAGRNRHWIGNAE